MCDFSCPSSPFVTPSLARHHKDRERAQHMSENTKAPARHFACGHVVPDCEFTVSAPTEEELLKKVAGHAAQAHGITEITPELVSQVRAAIETR